jgi:diadenosine tetraphosphate (Ap4A) HIT family hydrolase
VSDCVFCSERAGAEALAANALAVAVSAGYPVSPGHALIVPRRHEPDFFSLSAEEQAAVIA